MKKYLVFFIASVYLMSVATPTDRPFYLIQRSETLSEIAYRHVPGRVYGKNGSLKKLMALNKHLKNPDVIYPGQKIILSEDSYYISQTGVFHQPAKAPAREPAQEENSKPVSGVNASSQPTEALVEEEIQHHLKYIGRFNFTTLSVSDNVTNASAQLYTTRDLTGGAGWQQDWTEDVSTLVSFSMRNLEIAPSTNVNKQLATRDANLFSMSLGAQVKHSEKLKVNYVLDYSQHLYVRGISTNSISVDSVAVPRGTLEVQYPLFAKGKTSVGSRAGLSYILGSSADGYTISNGMGFSVSGYILHKRPEDSFELNLGYSQRNQKTSIVEVTEKNIFLGFIYSLPLFKENKK